MVHRSGAGNFPPESDDSRRNEARVNPGLAEFAAEEEGRLENRGVPLTKRPRFDSSDQTLCDLLGNSMNGYNLLQEPSPLGLKLNKTPSFLDLIQMKLCQERSPPLAMSLSNRERKQRKSAGPGAGNKLKASNFPATGIRIGTWEHESTYEGDLMAKFYFAKHKIVWEVLDGGLKNKIEIQWSAITSIKATYCGNGPETLDVVVGERPLFFREKNPQPRKHTVWKESTDFTGGRALAYRRHVLQFAKGILEKHFEKLIQCDPRLNYLSQQPGIVLEDPIFDGVVDQPEKSTSLKRVDRLFDLESAASLSARSEFASAGPVAVQPTLIDLDSPRTSPPALAADSGIMGSQAVKKDETFEGLEILDQIKLPSIHPSMSRGDLAGHIGRCISEQLTSYGNHGLQLHEEADKKSMVEDIAEYLLSDSQVLPDSEEKSLMSRVNSLCSFLLKEVPSHTNFQTLSEESKPSPKLPTPDIPNSNADPTAESEALGMSRKDSAGELLLYLPRIASLPHFLNNIREDGDKR